MKSLDRSALKKEAKSILKKDMLKIWKVLVINLIVSLLYSFLFTFVFKDDKSLLTNVLMYLYSFITIPLSFGINRCLLKITKGKSYLFKEIFYYYTHDVIKCLVVSIVVNILINLGTFCFIIPGIVLSLMLAMCENLFIDKTINLKENITKSINMMKGYKWDYFNFIISFMGWLLLGVFTAGIAFIYVLPYMIISLKLYYLELSQKA